MYLATAYGIIIVNPPPGAVPWDSEGGFALARDNDENFCARWLPDMAGPRSDVLAAIGQPQR